MTYCLGIMTNKGLVLASDSRTNAGHDQANVARKMHSFVQEGERVFVLLTSGNLSIAQSVITLLRRDFNAGRGLATVNSLYDAARLVGEQVRAIAALDGPALKSDGMKFNIHVLLGGQVKGERSGLYMIYSQGNPLRASKDACFLQIGECKYGKPLLDRGVTYYDTTLSQAAKYAVLSMDATMRSNVTVGPPIDLTVYHEGELTIRDQRRINEQDPDLQAIHGKWEQSLRRLVAELPDVDMTETNPSFYVPKQDIEQRQLDLDG